MGREVELKLEVPRAAVREAAQLAWLRERAGGDGKREKLVSVYFDTPKLKLRDHGLALRVRHVGTKRLQTIKAIAKGGRGALGRDEWEEEIAGTAPDLALAKGTALGPLVTKKLRRRLRPVFATVVERVTFPVDDSGSAVEIAIDRGYIKAGRRREAISEIELELKGGDVAALARSADRLAHAFPVSYGARPKQDRGYALVEDEAAAAVRSAPIALDPGAATAEAFRTIALACLDQALGNARAVRAGTAEGIHQMRVGLRRLRAALSLFKPLIDGTESETVKTELKWLTGQLNAARDLDVLVAEGVRPLCRDAPMPETGVLARDLEHRRQEGFDRAKAAVDGDRYRKLGLAAALWIIGGNWMRTGDEMAAMLRERPATEYAAEVLGRRLKKILKRARRVAELDPQRRHKLRIAVKKLRYAAEFFAGLFADGKRGRTRFGKRLKKLQGALGRLNDIEVHRRIADSIVRGEHSPGQAQEALAIGFIAGREQTEIGPCLAAVRKSARRLGKTARYWA